VIVSDNITERYVLHLERILLHSTLFTHAAGGTQ
jgi:hypothetical protein